MEVVEVQTLDQAPRKKNRRKESEPDIFIHQLGSYMRMYKSLALFVEEQERTPWPSAGSRHIRHHANMLLYFARIYIARLRGELGPPVEELVKGPDVDREEEIVEKSEEEIYKSKSATEVQLDIGKSVMEEQVTSIDSRFKSGIKEVVVKGLDDDDDEDGRTMEKSEEKMDRGKSASEVERDTGKSTMEEQVPRIDFSFKLEMEGVAVKGLDDGDDDVITVVKLEEEMDKSKSINEVEMDIGKSAMDEQVPRINSNFKPEMEEEVMKGPDDDEEEITKEKLEKETDRGKLAIKDQDMTKDELDKLAIEEDRKTDEENFACHRSSWESTWGGLKCGLFPDMTSVSSMHFTHYTPGRVPDPVYGVGPAITLQIFSIEIELKDIITWPLSVYGVVAARDIVDRNRNLLFCCPRDHSKELTQQDPFLSLIGPSRAVLCSEPVDFEIQLREKGVTQSQDKVLISRRHCYISSPYHSLSTISIENRFCTAKIRFEKLHESVQATILGVRVIQKGRWPFKYGGRVVCYSPIREVINADSEGSVMMVTDPSPYGVVLLDSGGGEMPMGSDGYLHLSRRVVCVELQRHFSDPLKFEESLKVVIQAFSPSGCIMQGHVKFKPKRCNISQGTCMLGDSKVEITVAWSCAALSNRTIATQGWVEGCYE